MRYEQLIQFLNELPKTDFFDNLDIVQEYKGKIKEFNVNTDILDKLNEEFKLIFEMSQNYENVIKPPNPPFKHYTSKNKKMVAIYFPK